MKLKCTINIGNFSNISIESSDQETVEDAQTEICNAGKKIGEPAVIDFCKKFFKG